jgi:hypothetical protein
MQNQNDRNVQAFVLAFVTLISLGTSPSLAAFEAIITNERSGDLIHINSEGSTTHVATLCTRLEELEMVKYLYHQSIKLSGLEPVKKEMKQFNKMEN